MSDFFKKFIKGKGRSLEGGGGWVVVGGAMERGERGRKGEGGRKGGKWGGAPDERASKEECKVKERRMRE